MWKSLKERGLKPGNWIVLPGAGGGHGHLGVQYAKQRGLRVIAIDAGEAKAKLCLQTLGAEKFIDFTKTKDVVEEVMKITGKDAHGVMVTASNKTGYEKAPYLVRNGGVMCIGISKILLCLMIQVLLYLLDPVSFYTNLLKIAPSI